MQKSSKILKEEVLNKWMDKEGMIGLNMYPDPLDCENGPLFTAIFYLLCFLLGILTDEDKERLQNAYEKLHKKNNKDELIRGLYIRSIGREKENDSHDNYVGRSAISAILNMQYHKDILNYGILHGFCFNSKEPNKYDVSCQHQGKDIAFYKIIAGYRPIIWHSIWLIIGIFSSALKWKEADGSIATSSKILNWLRLKGITYSDKAWNKRPFVIVEDIFAFLIRRKFKNGMADAFDIYYKAHPLADMMRIYIKEYSPERKV